ncbi:uncharacterized protein [Montipora foliosa]|uniref:uncharacterized protein n=1 Tax=Montipora foliosa TaxID=591990 RepID=UPI0035F11BF9
MITGDFNLHLDDKSDPTCINFLQLLESFNLRQHVREPTHRSGHTLDLIITREDEKIIGPVSVTESIISDRNIVNCSLNLLKPTLMKRCISSRKIKSIDIERLKSDICDSLGPNTDISIDVNDLVSRYCSKLTRIMDIHAPLKKRHVLTRPAAPWYNDEIKDAKRLRRRHERRWRRSRDPVDHSNFVKQCRAVTDLLQSSRRSDYYTDLINSKRDDSRKMFRTVGKLLHTKPVTNSSQFPSHSSMKDLAEKFMHFFDAKVNAIHQELMLKYDDNTFIISDDNNITCKFEAFISVSLDTLLALIRPSSGKSCDLDPLPGSLLRACLSELGPILTQIVNQSLQSAVVLEQLKVAMVKPLLKKPSLIIANFKNFRPISNLQFLAKIIEKVVADQLINYLDDDNLQEVYQSAYKRRLASTMTF